METYREQLNDCSAVKTVSRQFAAESNRMQFCDAKDATQQGKNKGDKFHWNVYSDVGTQGAALAENQVMPETNFTITQGELTITEMGNSVLFA